MISIRSTCGLPVDSSRIALISGEGSPDSWGGWSYFPAAPVARLRCCSQTRIATLTTAEGIIKSWNDPLEAIAWMGSILVEPPTPGPPFKGGWIGYFSYDLGRLFESLPQRAVDDLRLPLFDFTFHGSTTARNGQQYSIETSHPFGSGILPAPETLVMGDGLFGANFQRTNYEAAVRRAIEYIAAGDIFQVNLSQRFTAALRQSPVELFDRLQRQSPAGFAARIESEGYALLSNSPELFLRVIPQAGSDRRRIITRPIKGTRPRRAGMDIELRESIKDQAELNMIVDLERNDLGRVCEIGSVKVTQRRTIEAHPTVFHGVATVEGSLRADVTLVDLLKATFPGGSVTGAPKIRAMEIIDELEPVRRGPYCGAIGYLSVDGHIEFNIAIRTMILQGGRVHIPVGGAVVADSNPADEYDETLIKARAMFAALGVSTKNAEP